MALSTQTVFTRGIYHGLPTFPNNPGPYTAIITGANGISGYYMLRVLSQSPERWSKIYCLSRRPPLVAGGLPSNAEHIALDFLKSPEEIASTLRDKVLSKVDYVFFFSYIQVPPKEGMCRVNTLLVSNFLSALPLASLNPKRIMLQTGAKNYGGYLGLIKQPQEESDPRVELEPNFYYPQEDATFSYCKQYDVGWNVLMPGPILGAVPDAAMNIAFPLAVYAAVCRKLGSVFEFPGDEASYQFNCSMSSSMMNAYMEEWAVLTDAAKDQRFNAFDGGAFTWEGGWRRIAGWYGIKWKGPELEDGQKLIETESRFNPRGYGGKGVTRRKFRLVDWAKKQEVKQAWTELAEEFGLVEKELRDVDRVFAFLDGSLCRPASLNFSSDKARKLGWHGFVDSSESFLEVFEDLAKLKMIPPVPRVEVRFL